MRKLIGVLSFTAAMLGGSTAFAQAQGFGKSGTAALGAERVFGFYKLRVHTEAPNNGPEDDHDYTGFGFGWGAGAGTLGSPFEVPRVGFDYFIIDSLSLGGALGYASFEDDDGDEDISAFLLAPRVGYFIGLSDLFGFWPRGGFSYHSKSLENNDESGLALTLEAYFTLTPVEHFGFMFGPTLDMDFMGERECGGPNNSEDCKYRYRSIGLVQVGLFGWF